MDDGRDDGRDSRPAPIDISKRPRYVCRQWIASTIVMTATPFVLYGAPGSGATPVHAALTLIGEAVKVVDVAPWQGDLERNRLTAINPMRQVPVLVLPSGEIMTESAAMLIWLADRYPEAGLAPLLDDPMRAQYLRWMSFVSSSIYSLYWARDEPSRLAATEEGEAVVLDRTAERRAVLARHGCTAASRVPLSARGPADGSGSVRYRGVALATPAAALLSGSPADGRSGQARRCRAAPDEPLDGPLSFRCRLGKPGTVIHGAQRHLHGRGSSLPARHSLEDG